MIDITSTALPRYIRLYQMKIIITTTPSDNFSLGFVRKRNSMGNYPICSPAMVQNICEWLPLWQTTDTFHTYRHLVWWLSLSALINTTPFIVILSGKYSCLHTRFFVIGIRKNEQCRKKYPYIAIFFAVQHNDTAYAAQHIAHFV